MNTSKTLFETKPVDPGYGSSDAPEGSEEWAKRWRLEFQATVGGLLGSSDKHGTWTQERWLNSWSYFKKGCPHRAWTLLTDKYGDCFKTFEEFCECPEPYGLGIPYDKYRTHMVAEFGKEAVDLLTVPPDGRSGNGANQHTGPKEESTGEQANPRGRDRQTKLRAILRAPEPIQDLYREGLVSQTTAALLGPKKPDEEQASKIVQAREAVSILPKPDPEKPKERRQYRKQVDHTIREVMGKPKPKPLDQARRLIRTLSRKEKESLRLWLEAGCPDE